MERWLREALIALNPEIAAQPNRADEAIYALRFINQNVHVEAERDDIDKLVLDADVLDAILKDTHPGNKAQEVEIKLIARPRKHAGNPKFKELRERLEKIREKHEQGLLNSLEFLKGILEIARDTVEAEKSTDPTESRIARWRRSPSFSTKCRASTPTSSSSGSWRTSTPS